jgi:glutaminyl-tRNA synthetase
VFEYGKDKYPSLPNQTEFARLNLSYTVMSKRKLLTLVEANVVKGWDDPRMPTISGLRRRGYTPNSIRMFVETVGVAKRENIIDVSLLEFCVRQDLNKKAQRVMAVLDPVKLVINNYVENKEELFEADNNPEEQNAGSHQVPFSRELYIEREDFKENAGGKFFRLTLGGEVRLKNAYIIKGNSVVKDAEGKIMEVHCTYDPESLSGSGSQASLRKVKGTLHWVSIKHAIKAEVRVYDRLFNDEAPDSHKDKSFMDFVNPNSLTVSEAFIEPFLGKAKPGESFQFQRLGYFNVDKDSSPEQLVFNKTVGLRDSWTKKKPVQNNPKQVNLGQSSNRPPIEIIKQFGKKYTNLPPEKQEKIRAEIQELAKNVSYEDLQPLFATAAKKAGTRTVAMISLGVLLANGQQKTQEAQEFINRGVDDKNALLVAEAKILC